VTTAWFLETFGLETLGDLPSLEALQDAGLTEAANPPSGIKAPAYDHTEVGASNRQAANAVDSVRPHATRLTPSER
jgi:hypothetical protein